MKTTPAGPNDLIKLLGKPQAADVRKALKLAKARVEPLSGGAVKLYRDGKMLYISVETDNCTHQALVTLPMGANPNIFNPLREIGEAVAWVLVEHEKAERC